MAARAGKEGRSGKKIEVHAYTEDPTTAWEMLKAKRPVKLVRPMALDSPIRENAARFVCLSDIHSRALDPRRIPNGDILLVAGDFTTAGHPDEVAAFSHFLRALPHRYKVIIAGNHECTFDPNFMKGSGLEKLIGGDVGLENLRTNLREAMSAARLSDPRQVLLTVPGLYLLHDSSVTIHGISIYGSSWVPHFDGWAFNVPRGSELLEKWSRIPSGVDVLLTHTPPLGHGDLTAKGVRAGCVELLNSVSSRIRPKYHVFGHIHDGAGCTTDGYTKFINACTCDGAMRAINPPVLFDVALSAGVNKASNAAPVVAPRRSLS